MAYWNVNEDFDDLYRKVALIKVVAYWNVNTNLNILFFFSSSIKVVAYWNVNLLHREVIKGNLKLK